MVHHKHDFKSNKKKRICTKALCISRNVRGYYSGRWSYFYNKKKKFKKNVKQSGTSAFRNYNCNVEWFFLFKRPSLCRGRRFENAQILFVRRYREHHQSDGIHRTRWVWPLQRLIPRPVRTEYVKWLLRFVLPLKIATFPYKIGTLEIRRKHDCNLNTT